jgi:Glycosyl hydrolases family 16
MNRNGQSFVSRQVDGYIDHTFAGDARITRRRATAMSLALLASPFAGAWIPGKADDVGAEVLSSAEPKHVFRIRRGQGAAIIKNFNATAGQKIRLSGYGAMSRDQLVTMLKQIDGDTVLDLGGGQTLRIAGIGPDVISSIELGLDRSGLVQTFADDFDTLSLDFEGDHVGGQRGTWRTNFGYGGPLSVHSRTLVNNAELEVYVDRLFAGTGKSSLNLDPFRIVNGNLEIIADRLSEEVRPLVWMRNYSSGLLTTKASFSQTYGVFEIRARMPGGKGLWPAFWLLPVNGDWPPEIDVLEILGDKSNTLYCSWHSNVGGQHTADTKIIDVPDTSAGFHTYSLEWTREVINWYFDEVQVASHPTPQDFHQPMYMLVNLAVGGHWPGDPDRSTKFPATFSIDWIRAYKRGGAE